MNLGNLAYCASFVRLFPSLFEDEKRGLILAVGIKGEEVGCYNELLLCF